MSARLTMRGTEWRKRRSDAVSASAPLLGTRGSCPEATPRPTVSPPDLVEAVLGGRHPEGVTP